MCKLKEELDILFICNSLDLGGAEKIMFEIIKSLNFCKKEIICLKGRGHLSKLFEKEGVKITYFNLNKNIFDFIKILKIYGFITQKKPKIIHSFLYHSDVKLIVSSKVIASEQHKAEYSPRE